MIELLPKEETSYDIISGISIGSFNALGISLFEKGKEDQASEFITKIWKTVERKNIWKFWPIDFNLLFHPGLIDFSPANETLHKIVEGREVKRDIIVGATDGETGKYVRFTNDDLKDMEDFIHACLCSGAFPVIVPYQKWRNTTWYDGAVTKNFDVVGPI